MKGRLLRQAKRQLRETGMIDSLLYMDLNNAGINADALIEEYKDEM